MYEYNYNNITWLNLASFPTGIAASNLDKKQIYLILNNYEESTKDSHHMEELLEITREGLSSTSPKTTMVPFGGHLFWLAACLQVVICLRKLVLAASPLMLSTFFSFLGHSIPFLGSIPPPFFGKLWCTKKGQLFARRQIFWHISFLVAKSCFLNCGGSWNKFGCYPSPTVGNPSCTFWTRILVTRRLQATQTGWSEQGQATCWTKIWERPQNWCPCFAHKTIKWLYPFLRHPVLLGRHIDLVEATRLLTKTNTPIAG